MANNPHIQEFSWANTVNIFRSTVISTYIPLTIFSFNLEHSLFGMNPFFFHLNNILLHIGCCLLIFFLILKLRFSPFCAFFTALIFGIHPIHVESVAWITERKDVLYGFFYLLSILCYLNYLEKKEIKFYLLSLFFAIVSILSKAMALSLPLILLLIDWFTPRTLSKKTFLEKIPFLLFIGPIVWITYSRNLHILVISPSFLETFLIWIWSFSFYIQKFFIPLNFSLVYTLPKPVSFFNPSYFFSLFLSMALPFFLFFFRKYRLFLFSWAFYFFSIFFLLRTSDLSELDIVADRFMYLPSLGFCLLISHLFEKAIKSNSLFLKKLTLIFFPLIVLFLGIKTFHQTFVWKDTISLWSNVLKYAPQTFEAYNYRGYAYSERNLPLLALKDLNKSIELNPSFYKAYNNRGTVYLKMKDLPSAFKNFNTAVTLYPKYEKAHYNLGRIFFNLHKYSIALRKFQTVKFLNPKFPNINMAIGDCFVMTKQFSEAIESYSSNILQNPKNSITYNNRALVYNTLGSYDSAIQDLNISIALNPNSFKAYNNRGLAFLHKKIFQNALNDFTHAIYLFPNNANAFYYRAKTYFEMKIFDKASQDALTAFNLGVIESEELLAEIQNHRQ
ncbi:MAG: tetratricopeptide repeat protein [Candidatus Omnitrophica bacterium]|nr:tetratricopeptide repeat protein [Candidatus Omnitrophota bacterium]